MQNVITQIIRAKFTALAPLLDERTRRRWAAVEARAIGRGIWGFYFTACGRCLSSIANASLIARTEITTIGYGINSPSESLQKTAIAEEMALVPIFGHK